MSIENNEENLAPYAGADHGELSGYEPDPHMRRPKHLGGPEETNKIIELTSMYKVMTHNINNLVRENRVLRKKAVNLEQENSRLNRRIRTMEGDIISLQRKLDHLTKMIDNITETGIMVQRPR